ncbi:transglycosylase, partial [Staphylococcus condimenti]
MKKLLVVSSVATAAFLATGAASHNAHAAEVSQSEQQLAETALNNPSELNQHPVQAGAYNIDFVYNGNEFHFESDGSNWSWSYNATSASNSSVQPTQATTTQAAPAQQAA